MKTKRLLGKAGKWLLVAVTIPVVLFLLAAVAIYLPPVQNYAVQRVARSLSESTGMKISVGYVRLAFPLDLAVNDVQAIDGRDTVVEARALRLDVRLMPLFKGRADIDGFGLYGAKVNTKDFVADTYLRGHVGLLKAKVHGVEWTRGQVHLDEALLRDADLYVALSDTAAKDTTPSSPWNIVADRITVEGTSVSLSLPGDSMRVAARIGKAVLAKGHFDTGRPHYAVGSLDLRDGNLTYAVRPGRSGGPTANTAFTATRQKLWAGYPPAAKGFDPGCIVLERLNLHIDTLSYDRDGTLRAGLAGLSLRERCGLEVKNVSGSLYMDSVRLSLPALNLRTAHSRLDASVSMDLRALQAGRGGNLSVHLDAAIGSRDVRLLGRGMLDESYLKAWPEKELRIRADVGGNSDHLVVGALEASLPGALRLTGSAKADFPLEDRRHIAARFSLRGDNLTFVKAFLPAESRNSFDLPRGLALDGTVTAAGNRYKADLRAKAKGGSLTAKGEADLDKEAYRLSAGAKAFPLGAFLPETGLGNFSGELTAAGSGFDVLAPQARMEAKASVSAFRYDQWDLGGIRLNARIKDEKADIGFTADNELLEGSGTVVAGLGREITARLTADLPSVNLQKLAGMADTLRLGADVDIAARAARDFSALSAEGGIRHLRFLTPQKSMMAKDLLFAFATDRDTTTAHVSAGDLHLNLGAAGTMDGLASRFGLLAELLSGQLDKRELDQEALKRELPTMALSLDAGKDNPMSRILNYKGIDYTAAHLRLNTGAEKGLEGTLDIGSLKSGNLLLDTVALQIFQDTAGVKLHAGVRNFTKRNPNKFEVKLDGYLLASGVGARMVFLDEAGRCGIDLGLQAVLADGGINVSLYPEHPIVAYRNFTVNEDNFIYLGKDKSLRADVDLLADDGTGLRIYSQPADSVNDVTVSISHLNLGELSDVMPYLPELEGMLNGDFHLVADSKSLSTSALFQAEGLRLEGVDLGDVGIEAIYLPKEGGEHYANAYVSADGKEVLDCEGTYKDSEGGTFEGTARLHDFPLQMLNGFLAGTDIGLTGTAGGDLSLQGSLDKLQIDGQLDFDTAHLYSDVYGFDFLMDERPIAIKNSRMLFTDFGLHSRKSGNPLVMNGTLDFTNFDRITLDFAMKATDFELINAQRKAASLVFGKVYANYNGTLRGTMDNLSVRGKLEVLGKTDMTYILKDSPLTVDDRLHDLVKFVSFEDSVEVAEETPVVAGGFDMSLGISISDAARFHCFLSEDGQNYVDLEGGGELAMRITQQGDLRMTGRVTVNEGEMKYSLPVIPLKTFNIVQGSYVDFTGDVANPTLNIAAKERVKATVTENDQPRTVAFDVGVAITKPLSNMGLEFTIEAPEDLSVQNQLTSMTAAQRSKAAVAMLATGMYMTDDMTSGGSGFKASNALNAFLQSEIQNIAGSALKTIDVTIGMESGTSTAGTETTDYSFQFAKRFWGNRISVIIGGKVSTGQDAENSAESFIDNVAVEYRLDKGASRYVRVFYDRGVQDPLEGQLTKTGVGLVLRRKSNRLGDLFLFRTKKDKTPEPGKQE